MLGDKQLQVTESGATALQAGRDIHVHGPSVSEVKELCILYLRDNFPRLKEEATRAAEEHVRTFATNLENRLAKDVTSIVLEKFKEPDVQAALNDAVQASARKGNAANPSILSTLISERVSKQSNDFKDTVISEAVRAVPRLTGQQIALLSFVHACRSMVYQGFPSIAALEQVGATALRFSAGGFGLSEVQKQHLQYAGAASVLNIVSSDIFDLQRQEYAYFGITDTVAFKEALANSAPSYSRLLEQFMKDKLYAVTLTSVGQAIALANISQYIPNRLDYSVWLQ